jgi:hypothetical protein
MPEFWVGGTGDRDEDTHGDVDCYISMFSIGHGALY